MYFHGYIGGLILKFIKSNVKCYFFLIILWFSLFYGIHVLFMLKMKSAKR